MFLSGGARNTQAEQAQKVRSKRHRCRTCSRRVQHSEKEERERSYANKSETAHGNHGQHFAVQCCFGCWGLGTCRCGKVTAYFWKPAAQRACLYTIIWRSVAGRLPIMPPPETVVIWIRPSRPPRKRRRPAMRGEKLIPIERIMIRRMTRFRNTVGLSVTMEDGFTFIEEVPVTRVAPPPTNENEVVNTLKSDFPQYGKKEIYSTIRRLYCTGQVCLD